MKLVLEGGGSRAAYQAGILDEVARACLPIKAVVGSSSGAVNAAFFASGQLDELLSLWGDYVPGSRFISWQRQLTPWGPPGLGVDDMLDNVFVAQGKLDIEKATRGEPALFVTATEVPSGKAIITRPDAMNLIEWLRASLAIPVGYNRTVEIEGRSYMDGGLATPIPFDLPLEGLDAGPTVVLLTRPRHTKKRGLNWWERSFTSVIVPPNMRSLAVRQHELYNQEVQRLKVAAERGEVLVFDPPDDLPIKRITRDRGRIHAGIDMGREVGRTVVRELSELG